jgi:hypothetical protein
VHPEADLSAAVPALIGWAEERVAYDVHEETFEDSWEYTREPYEEWRHFLVETELFDPTLWFLAWARIRRASVTRRLEIFEKSLVPG